MKNRKEKRHRGMKYKVREEKKKEQRIDLVVTAIILVILVSISGFFVNSMLNQPSTNETISSTSKPEAAIVDHLSLTRPNQSFIETTTKILEQAGYTVDYYPGEEVTVEFYRNLPTHDHKLIILRVHSSAAALEGDEYAEAPVSLFTSESYTRSKHVWEQLTNQLVIASYTMPQPPYYFAITPKFVISSMKSNFQETTIVMMGCEGINNTKMAEAFIERGARVYIGWDGSILGSRNDPAITCLLQHLIKEKKTVEEAVANTMKTFEPSPIDDSVMLYYPHEAGELVIGDIENNH